LAGGRPKAKAAKALFAPAAQLHEQQPKAAHAEQAVGAALSVTAGWAVAGAIGKATLQPTFASSALRIMESSLATPNGFLNGVTNAVDVAFRPGVDDGSGDDVGPVRGYGGVTYQFGSHIQAPPPVVTPTKDSLRPVDLSVERTGSSRTVPVKGLKIPGFGTVVMTERAEASVKWSSAKAGRLHVSLTQGRVAISDNHLSFEDSGVLHHWARANRQRPGDAAAMIYQQHGTSVRVSEKQLSVTISGKRETLEHSNLDTNTTFGIDKGVPTVTETTSQTLKTRETRSGSAVISYSIVTSVKVVDSKVRVPDLETLLEIAALAYLGAAAVTRWLRLTGRMGRGAEPEPARG
jgi:hypothetical protein